MTPEDSEQRLVFDCELEAPPEKVWRALTVPAFIDRWLMPVEGAGDGGFAGRPDVRSPEVEAEIVEADPPSRLSWNWREAGQPEGVVTFTLTPNEHGGTSLRLVHVRDTRAVRPAAANSNSIVMALAA